MEAAAEKSRSATVLDLQAWTYYNLYCYPICMFPTNSERLIGISDAFSAFVYEYPSSCPRAQCTPNKSVTTLRYTRRHGPVYIIAMPVGTYLDFLQSPGFPKIVYYVVRLSPLEAVERRACVTAFTCIVKLEVETV